MIAANYRKYPEAMAIQLVLSFGRALVWATKRPTTDALRTIRAMRGAAFKTAGRIAYPAKKMCPSWAREAAQKARELASMVRAAQQWLVDGTLNPNEQRYRYAFVRYSFATAA